MGVDQITGTLHGALVLNRTAFYAWAEAQAGGRYERIDGEVIRMSPERWRHARLKAEIWRFVDNTLIGIPGHRAVVDGLAVQIDDGTDYIPDVVIHSGGAIPPDSQFVPNPTVVIEVLSPSTQRIDTLFKAEAYLGVPSVSHYLMFRADRRGVAVLSRGSETPMHHLAGALIPLDPPGITLDIDAIYDRAEAS